MRQGFVSGKMGPMWANHDDSIMISVGVVDIEGDYTCYRYNEIISSKTWSTEVHRSWAIQRAFSSIFAQWKNLN